MVGIQVRDGAAAGIFGIVSVLTASDPRRATGRFNLAQGLTALAVGVGAGLGLTAGDAVRWFGTTAEFLYLATLASGALVFFAALVPGRERLPSRPR